jgi:hypothetical protein
LKNKAIKKSGLYKGKGNNSKLNFKGKNSFFKKRKNNSDSISSNINKSSGLLTLTNKSPLIRLRQKWKSKTKKIKKE